MSAPTMANGALVAQISKAFEDARANGQPTPGRPTLVALTGATDHAVRKALDKLATAGGTESPASAVLATAAAPTSPADRQAPAEPVRLVDSREPAGEPLVTTGDPESPASPAVTSAGEPVADLQNSGNRSGRLTAWAGFVFGSITSIAANVLAARIPPAGAGPHWEPNVFAEAGAAVWPLALLLSVEVLSRVNWPSTWQWKLAKFGGIVAVALGSAVISYGHIRAVLASWNYTSTGAGVGPLVVDGLMLVSGFALLAISHQRPASAGGGQS